jgi:bifunctional DNA-binding transcriptional regulator/antitoxin component of YhaV-PrlF toxin-antitoxin module
MPKKKTSEKNSEQELQKIAAIREMISNAERTIASARAMLAQIEGVAPKKAAPKIVASDEEGEIIEGVFDGQVMIGTDGKQYPVPANYASKSKLVEGDMLKLTITPDGSFVYKQIGPVERKRVIGIVSQDDLGNYVVIAEGKAYRVLLASVTYFKAEPGDEVTIVVPRDSETVWAAIENLVKKGSAGDFSAGSFEDENKPEERKIKTMEDRLGRDGKLDVDLVDEWAPDAGKLDNELSKSAA